MALSANTTYNKRARATTSTNSYDIKNAEQIYFNSLVGIENATGHAIAYDGAADTIFKGIANSPAAFGGDTARLTRDVYLYLVAQGDTINDPDVTFGTVTANGSNTGNGTLYRLTKDAYDNDLWAGHIETKTLECAVDQNTTGRRYAESFRMFGDRPGIDSLDVAGSGAARGLLAARHSGTDEAAGSLLLNSSFQSYSSSGDETTKFSGWTLGTAASVTQVTGASNIYRGYPGGPADADQGAMQMTAATTVLQTVTERTGRGALSRYVPYFLSLRVKPAGGADGSVTLHMGSQNESFLVSGLTTGVWNHVVLAVDRDLWWERFNEDQLDVGFEWTGTTGTVDFDDLIFCPFTFWNGSWWCMIGGDAPFLAASAALPNGDKFTVTDTETGAKLAYWNKRAGLGVLPSATAGAETITDP